MEFVVCKSTAGCHPSAVSVQFVVGGSSSGVRLCGQRLPLVRDSAHRRRSPQKLLRISSPHSQFIGVDHVGSRLLKKGLQTSNPNLLTADSAPVSYSASTVTCISSFSQAESAQSSFATVPSSDDTSSGALSAKERRKLRNERREQLKASAEPSWKEMVENKWLAKPKKAKGWEADADINQLIPKGMQWWMIQTTRKFEYQVAEQISIIFPETFPDREFEVLVPTLPTKTKLKDGTVSDARRKVFQGIVLLRCVLDRDVYDMVKRIPRAYEFFGNKAGVSYQPIIMPAPVSNFNMDNLFRKIETEEVEFQKFKVQCRKELEEEKKKAEEEEILKSEVLQLGEGVTIRVLSGPFTEFTGVVLEVMPEDKKVKALVTVFGKDTPIVLDMEQVVVHAAPPK